MEKIELTHNVWMKMAAFSTHKDHLKVLVGGNYPMCTFLFKRGLFDAYKSLYDHVQSDMVSTAWHNARPVLMFALEGILSVTRDVDVNEDTVMNVLKDMYIAPRDAARYAELRTLVGWILDDGLANHSLPDVLDLVAVPWVRVVFAARKIASAYKRRLQRRREFMIKTVIVPIIVRSHP